jgi:putative ABC transport system permease protein
MLLGIALGVAVAIAIDVANESSRRAFQFSTEAIIGRATHQIRGGPSGIPEAIYHQIRVDLGFRSSAPLVEGIGSAVDFNGEPLQILGVDPLSEAPFRNYLQEAPYLLSGFERFYIDPSSVIISRAFAERHSLNPGDTLRIQTNDKLETLRVLAILNPREGQVNAALDNLLLMDIASAQELTGTLGTLSRIDLVITEDQAEDLRRLLPVTLQLKHASEQASTVAQLTSAFELNLTALSLLALVVGMFMIYNTMMFSVVQRRTSLGTLRVLGVTGIEIFTLVLLESVIVGMIGSALGIAMGYGLGRGAVQLVSQTINDLYFVVTVREIVFNAEMLIKGMAIGILAAVIAAALPAAEAARVPAVTVLQRSKFEIGFKNIIPRISALGLLIVGGSVGLLFLFSDSLPANFGALFLLVLGIAFFVPWTVRKMIKLFSPIFSKLWGLNARIAARRVVGSLSRTGIAIAALMIALAVTIGVSIMISSFRSTVENWLDITLQADLYISTPSFGGTRPNASLSPDLADRVAVIQGVATVETFRAVIAESPLGAVQLSIADGKRERDEGIYRFASGTASEVWGDVVQGSVIVSEPFANRYDIPSKGGEVTLYTDRGPQTFPVVAVYYDYSSDRGAVLMSDTVYREYWDDRSISSIAAYIANDADIETVASEIRDSLNGTGLSVQANRTIREQALQIFDRTFAITASLRVLTVLVAFIGVLSSLLALLLERRRERATMVALGMEPGDVLRAALIESGLIGATAGLISWPTGVLMALVLIYVINLRSFGWTINLQIDPWIFIQSLMIGVVAAMLASIYPIVKQMRAPIADSLRQE